MDNFIVSARKYRPITFDSVVGQLHITNTLKNAIKNNQLAQAFLFCGPRGVGKTTCARILAKTINCTQITTHHEACGVCESCASIQHGNSFNFHELDAASNNSVDDIRNLTDQVRIPPQGGKYKVYIIDEVHMLSQSAFNAFLKTLEEPPSYAIFILATTEKHKILPTILSRCQIFDFNRIKVDDMANHLQSIASTENINFDADGLHLIAQKADGGLRDALSMFDQIVSFSNREVTYQAVINNLNLLDYDYFFKVTTALLDANLASALLLFDEILNHGFEGNTFTSGLCEHFRNLLVCKDTATIQLLEVSENIKQRYQEQAHKASISFLISGLNIGNQCEINLKQSKNQRLQIELMLIKLSHLPSALNLSNNPNVVQLAEQVKKKPENLIPALSHTHIEPANTTYEATKLTNEIKEHNPIALAYKSQKKTTNQAIEPSASLLKKVALPANSLIPDLNNFKNSNFVTKTNEPQYLTGNQNNEFDESDLLTTWKAYIALMKQKNKMSLAALMESNYPILLPNFEIQVLINNTLQENELKAEKIDLVNYLRNQLKNFSINVTSIINSTNTSKKPYTSKDKYNYFVEKNPAINDLKNMFSLTFD
ncbi:MAG: DNA polymerase III subunit gamma/tau [Sphingobacteriales bacterium]|nr:MAG: DNA polymerase III subunit gamma/tau [Sphingobacteriales bacterium]TAF81149.1 MAG: DNA polymerase III subunit gamma/tau [Sphingobacteriales bacterium]